MLIKNSKTNSQAEMMSILKKIYFNIVANVDGQWGSWGEWSSCDGYGTECAHDSENYRTRVCGNPAPLGKGADCIGGKQQETKIGIFVSAYICLHLSEYKPRGGMDG